MDYWQTLRTIDPKNLVFIDEAGVNLAMIRLYARSSRGQRAIGRRPQRRGQNVSMVDALALKGPIAPLRVLGPMDGLTFEAYLILRVIPNLWPGACVVLDNNSTHHSTPEIEVALEKVGARLVYLPPYSPDFSPIELFWSKVKSSLKSMGARTYQSLGQSIERAYAQVTLKDIKDWFTFRCYCTSPN